MVRQGTLTPPSQVRFLPSQYDPLAQLAEHLTFNQGVWSSNLQWVILDLIRLACLCGRGGMADAPDLGSGAFGCVSSSLVARTIL